MPRLFALEAGSEHKPTLVLLHSGGMISEEWKDHIPFLSRRLRVIAPDMPGHGQSPLGDVERLRVSDMGRAVIQSLDERSIDKASIVGSSLGGAVALWLALNYPDRLHRVVLYRVSYRKDPDQYEQTLAIAQPERWVRLRLDRWLSRAHESQGGVEAWKRVISRVAEAMEPGTTDHNHSLQSLAQIPHETLIIVGDRDPLVPIQHAQEMYQTIPKAGLWIMPGATHITATNTWRRDIFDQEVERFIRRGLRPPQL